MKKTYIETNEVKKLKRIDSLGYLLPVLIFIMLLISDIPRWKGADFNEPTWSIFLSLLIFTILFSIPVVLIWRAVFRQLKRNAIKRSTFNPELGLDYYRDKLGGLSPVEISMLIDLEVEPEKDISALLLKYQMKGIINIDEKKVQVLKPDDQSLLSSDKILLQTIIDQGELSYAILGKLQKWEMNVYNEIIQSGYFNRKDRNKLEEKKNYQRSKGCAFAFLTPVLILTFSMIIFFSPLVQYTYGVIETMQDDTTNSDLFRMMAEDHNFAIGTLILTLMLFLMGVVIFGPIAILIKSKIKTSGFAHIIRTKEGEEMTEYIYAMKNFLHDFSTLSEANKEQLVLWDDFLIYAVVLEENEQILQDIFSQRSLELDDFYLR